MPGMIQVSILELVGIPSVQSSSMGIKVTVGKQAHEAQDKGDFSFPLASFRDNLNVSVLDSEGNEIATTAVETRLIVEKGTWDDLFALQGGGQVHMRLQFVLSEDGMKRIRTMREYATRKKQEDILKRRHSSSDLANASGGSHASYQDSLRTIDRAERLQNANPAENLVSKSSVGSEAGVLRKGNPSQRIPSTPAFTTSSSTGELDKLVTNRAIKQVIQPQDQGSSDKTPSSSVRQMVLAFETNPVKEMPPAMPKTRSVPQISSTKMGLKRSLGANAKPAPIPGSTEKVTGETQYEEEQKGEKSLEVENIKMRSARVEQKEEKADLKLQNNSRSSKKDVEKREPTREEGKEAKRGLEFESIDHKMQPTREEEEEEKKDSSLLNSGYMSNEINNPQVQPSREEKIKEEKKDLKLQNLGYMSSRKDVPEMQTVGEERKEEKKDITKVQPTREEQSEKKDINEVQPTREGQMEEQKDLKVENLEYMSRNKEGIKMQPTVEDQEEKGFKTQNVDYLNDTPEMQPTREEQNNKEKKDLELQNVSLMSIEKDLPETQPVREEAKEYEQDVKLEDIDYLSGKKDIPGIQPTREDQKEEQKSPEKLHLSSNTAESSRLSWGTLVQAFPSRSQSSTDTSTESPHGSFSLGHSKVKSIRNVNYTASDMFHEWIFLDEMMIGSCILSDDMQFIDLLEGRLSVCSLGTDQGKLADGDLAPNKDEKKSGQQKSVDSEGRSNDGNPKRPPLGQVIKIAIMVGVGVLVFLTRQRR